MYFVARKEYDCDQADPESDFSGIAFWIIQLRSGIQDDWDFEEIWNIVESLQSENAI